MKTFNQLSANEVTNFTHANAIQFDLHNFDYFIRNNRHVDLSFVHAELDKCLTKIYKCYENKNTSDSTNHLENS